jgi:hypothetical protein
MAWSRIDIFALGSFKWITPQAPAWVEAHLLAVAAIPASVALRAVGPVEASLSGVKVARQQALRKEYIGWEESAPSAGVSVMIVVVLNYGHPLGWAVC